MYQLKSNAPEKFEFEFEGETYAIPARTSLPMKKFRAIRRAINASDNPEETTFDEIMALFDEYVPDVMDRIDLGQAMSLFTAYSTGGEEPTLGES